jgi:hypothetical protein
MQYFCLYISKRVLSVRIKLNRRVVPNEVMSMTRSDVVVIGFLDERATGCCVL